jgi:hypothetical protein
VCARCLSLPIRHLWKILHQQRPGRCEEQVLPELTSLLLLERLMTMIIFYGLALAVQRKLSR